MPTYVLTGVGGKMGGMAARYVLDFAGPDDKLVFTSSRLGSIPKKTVENWVAKSVKISAANYDDFESLKAVFAGADAVTMISTWSIGGRRKQAQNVIQAAQYCGVRRVCYTSFVGADRPDPEEEMLYLPRDHRFVEQLLFSSGLEYNIQRNNLYIDNIPELDMPSWKYCGDRWLINTHGMAGAYVAREDCSRVLAALLLGRAPSNTIWGVTGPEALSADQIVRRICAHTDYNRETDVVYLSDQELKDYWLQQGLPDDLSGDFSGLTMKQGIKDLLCCGQLVARGFMKNVSNAVEELTGLKAISFEEFLMKYVQAFGKP